MSRYKVTIWTDSLAAPSERLRILELESNTETGYGTLRYYKRKRASDMWERPEWEQQRVTDEIARYEARKLGLWARQG